MITTALRGFEGSFLFPDDFGRRSNHPRQRGEHASSAPLPDEWCRACTISTDKIFKIKGVNLWQVKSKN